MFKYANIDDDLIEVAKIGDLEKVKLLLEAGADVNARGAQALRWAAENGHTEVVKLLLAAGANTHTDDNYALRWAARKGHTGVVKLLLEAGANVHAQDNFALRWAAIRGHLEVVKVLLAAGANVHAQDNFALRWAAEYGHTEVVKLLLAAGADADSVLENCDEETRKNIILAKYGEDYYKKYLARSISKNKDIPQIDYEGHTSSSIKNKNHPDLELLKRLKGYLHETP